MSPPEAEVVEVDHHEQTRSRTVINYIVSLTISALNARGGHKIDPGFVLDRDAIKRVGKVMCVYSTKPLVNGAALLLELFYRLLLLIIFLALSYSPRHRSVVVERLRSTLESHVTSVRRLAMTSSATAPFSKSHLPADASILMVGGNGVGKTSLARTLKRLARKAGMDELSIAESHGPRLPDLDKLQRLELVLIVWEATQDTPLPAYVARYTQQLMQRSVGASASGSMPEAIARSGEMVKEPHGARERRGRRSLHRGDPALDAAGTVAGGSELPSGAAAAPSRHGRSPRVLVLCNKTDVMPCPMPQIRGLPADQAFIAETLGVVVVESPVGIRDAS